MLYVHCHGLCQAPAPLRVSYHKLNPSHRGPGRGRGRPGGGAEGQRRPQASRLGPGHQAWHQPPGIAHQPPWTSGLGLLRSRILEKTQLTVDSATRTGWRTGGPGGSSGWLGAPRAPGPGSTLSLSPADPTPRPPPTAAAGASGPVPSLPLARAVNPRSEGTLGWGTPSLEENWVTVPRRGVRGCCSQNNGPSLWSLPGALPPRPFHSGRGVRGPERFLRTCHHRFLCFCP